LCLREFGLQVKRDLFNSLGVIGSKLCQNLDTQKQTEKFRIKKFRVLTITSSEARCRNMIRAAEAKEEVRRVGGLFFFAAEKVLPLSSPESVLNKFWRVPGKDEPCSLF
jgi:hypothetical protein